jgi:hypothetical protein
VLVVIGDFAAVPGREHPVRARFLPARASCNVSGQASGSGGGGDSSSSRSSRPSTNTSGYHASVWRGGRTGSSLLDCTVTHHTGGRVCFRLVFVAQRSRLTRTATAGKCRPGRWCSRPGPGGMCGRTTPSRPAPASTPPKCPGRCRPCRT